MNNSRKYPATANMISHNNNVVDVRVLVNKKLEHIEHIEGAISTELVATRNGSRCHICRAEKTTEDKAPETPSSFVK
jgi:hypothetical protein